jgi:hypothetical protein
MSADSWSVREAATRLLCSEASIRRRIASEGDLQVVPGAKPLRVTAESVAAVQDEMLRKMGVGPTSAATPVAAANEERVAQLEADVQTLQGALADLTASNAAMLDTYRRLSAGAVPNN